jgi:hypothetical protein
VTTFSRAKLLIANQPAVAAVLAILPLAVAASPARASFAISPFTFTGAGANYQNDPGDVSDPTAVFAAVGSNPIVLSASATVPAATYTNNAASAYFLEWDGNIAPAAFPVGNTLTMQYDVFINIAGATPGDGQMVIDSTIGGAPLLIDIENFSGPTTEIKGSVSEPITDALSSDAWDVVLSLDWFNFSPDAVLNISVPAASSIDLSVAAPTPEPASLGILAAATATLLLQRRRKLTHP